MVIDGLIAMYIVCELQYYKNDTFKKNINRYRSRLG